MKLEKFQEKDKKRIGFIVFTVACILLVSGVILYRTFAIFEVKTNQNVIKGTVQDPGNIYFAFYKDGEIQKDMLQSGSGYVLDEEASYCGVNGSHDDNIKVTLTEDYVIQVHGVTTSRTKCNLYFVKGKFIQGKGVPIVEEGDGLYEVNHADSTLEDGWKNTEYRFAGKDPKNYIEFNGELWRIIGLVNVKTNDGIEQRLKIIRNSALGEYGFDYKKNGVGSSCTDWGSNDWTDSQLMEMLNGIYYNSEKGTCWKKGENDVSVSTECNFDGTEGNEGMGLKKVQDLIDKNIIWNLGGVASTQEYYQNNKIQDWYNNERGTEVYKSGNVSRPTEWKKDNTKDSSGQSKSELFHSIGLMYPSDFVWATGGGTLGRESCFNVSIWTLKETQGNQYFENCAKNDWIFDLSSERTWTLTPDASLAHRQYSIGMDSSVFPMGDHGAYQVLPTLYLKTNVKILNDGQDGSEKKPFHLVSVS